MSDTSKSESPDAPKTGTTPPAGGTAPRPSGDEAVSAGFGKRHGDPDGLSGFDGQGAGGGNGRADEADVDETSAGGLHYPNDTRQGG